MEDYVKNNQLDLKIANTKNLWLVIPKTIALKYTKSQEIKREIVSLAKQGKIINPLFYKHDLNIKRLLYLIKSHLSHFKKYSKYYK